MEHCVLGWSVTWAVKEFKKEQKVQRVKVLFLLSQGRERARCRDMHQHQP